MRAVLRALRLCAADAPTTAAAQGISRQPLLCGVVARGHACFLALPATRRDVLVSQCYEGLLEMEMELLLANNETRRHGGDGGGKGAEADGAGTLRPLLGTIIPGVLDTMLQPVCATRRCGR